MTQVVPAGLHDAPSNASPNWAHRKQPSRRLLALLLLSAFVPFPFPALAKSCQAHALVLTFPLLTRETLYQ